MPSSMILVNLNVISGYDWADYKIFALPRERISCKAAETEVWLLVSPLLQNVFTRYDTAMQLIQSRKLTAFLSSVTGRPSRNTGLPSVAFCGTGQLQNSLLLQYLSYSVSPELWLFPALTNMADSIALRTTFKCEKFDAAQESIIGHPRTRQNRCVMHDLTDYWLFPYSEDSNTAEEGQGKHVKNLSEEVKGYFLVNYLCSI